MYQSIDSCTNFVFFTILAPSPPTALVAVPSNNTTAISLTWNRPATPNGQITRYEIQYNAAGSSDVTSKVLSANQLPVLMTLIDSLKPFKRYQFRIRAATGEKVVMWGNVSAVAEARTGEAGICLVCTLTRRTLAFTGFVWFLEILESPGILL